MQRSRAPWRSGFAVLAIAASLWGTWIADIHGGVGDAACAAELESSPAGHARIIVRSGDGTATPHHCYVCHWLRSLHSSTPDASTATLAVLPIGWIVTPSAAGSHASPVHLLPARSPPAV